MLIIDETGNMQIIRQNTACVEITVDDYAFSDGDKAFLSVKKNIDDTKYILRKTVSDFATNVVQFKLSEDDTDLEEGDYVYDIQLRLTDGTIDTIVGPKKLTIIKSVSYSDTVGNTPATEAFDSIYKLYTVQENDTLKSIALANSTTIKELKTINNLDSSIIYIGQVLKVGPAETEE